MQILDQATLQTRLVVLQPTPFCNINCRYCYLPDRSLTKRMTQATLSRILMSIFSSPLLADKITIVWHAGEPLVLPLSFYERAIELIEQSNTRAIPVTMAFQTNGTLLTQEWCDFIKRHQISMSVSLDGPRHLHDRERVDRRGRGTFERTMRGVRLLQEHGIEPGIIMVLTRQALAYPEEIWQFFQDHHLSRLAFNVEEINGVNLHSSLESGEDIARYKEFLRRFLILRDSSISPPHVRDIDLQIERIRSLSHPVYADENTPLSILSFDYQGNIATFASELLTMKHPRYGNFHLGNVREGPLEAILAHPKLLAMNTEVQNGVARCRRACSYFTFCGGGSPVNKLSENGTFDSSETMQCKLRIQATLDVVFEHLENTHPKPPIQ